MISARLFPTAPLAVALTVLIFSLGIEKVAAQDEKSGISVSRLTFGKQTDDKWLKVDMKSVKRSGLAGTRSSTGTPTVTIGSTAIRPTLYASPKIITAAIPAFAPAKTRVRNTRLLQAAGIAMGSAHAHSTGSCWRYVKSALLKAEVIDSYPKTGYAKQAASELVEDYGFVRTKISNPLAAPVGSVLVYGGAGAGHIEIRTMNGFVSDFVSAKPSNRPLIGVFVK